MDHAPPELRGCPWDLVENRANVLRFSKTLRGACASAASAGSAGRIRPPHGRKNATTPVRPSAFSSGNKANTRNGTCRRSCCLTSRRLSDRTRSIAYWSTHHVTGRSPQSSRRPGSGGRDPGLGPRLHNLRCPGAGVAPSQARPRHSRFVRPAGVRRAQAARRKRSRRESWL